MVRVGGSTRTLGKILPFQGLPPVEVMDLLGDLYETLLREDSAIGRAPPIAMQKLGHDAISAAAVPDQHAAGFEYARELFEYCAIILRRIEEPERGK